MTCAAPVRDGMNQTIHLIKTKVNQFSDYYLWAKKHLEGAGGQ
jgi:hypothetical protein